MAIIERTISLVVLVASALLLASCQYHRTAAQTEPVPTNIVAHPELAVTKPLASKFAGVIPGVLPPKPRMFKAQGYPPKTPEGKAMWDWWDAMEKLDPSFQWKMPIEFYGKVVDQFGRPVAGAEVELNWTTAVGPVSVPKKSIYAGADGRFAITGIQGNGITITADMEGYLQTSDSRQSFEYAAFYRDNFHVPDPNKPVIFRLQKLMGAEPMYKFLPYGDITVAGAPMILSVEKGDVASQGDLAFSIVLDKEKSQAGVGYSLVVQGLNGAGCVPSDEEFLFKAPDSGYQNTLKIAKRADNPSPVQKMKFYVRTAAGKFAAAQVEVNLVNNLTTADFSAILYYNPSGSRNLEFDHNKWINR